MQELDNKVIVVFSFSEKSLTPKVIAEIIEKGIGFEAKYVNTDIKKVRSGNCNILKRLDELREAEDCFSFELLQKKDEDCPSLFIHKRTTYDLFRMSFHYDKLPDDSFFDSLSNINGFNFGYIEDYEFNYWQNAENLSCYELRNLSHDHLPKKSNGLPFPVETTIIDITSNPCRNIKYPGMEFSISPLMWVNKSYIEIACPGLLQNENLFLCERIISDNVSCFRLLESLKPNGTELNKVSELANQIDLNSMGSKGKELIRKAPVDAVYEFNHLNIDGEKCREQLVWLDTDDKPINKSKAFRKLVNVFNSQGKRINAYFEQKG